jgi:filamentous hemagglutinin family protein
MSTFKDKRNAARREKISTVKLLSSTALTAAGLLIFSSAANAQIIDPNTVPTGANVISGGITIEQQGTNTDIYQNQEHGRINWNSFDHGSNAVTEFHQPSSDSWTVNKVVGNIGSARQTIIDGKIIANGNIGIIDQNGVLYGPNAVIDLNGAITTSGNLNESKFNESGIAEITQVGAGGGIEIMNGAQISVGSAGLAAFVAPTVVNNGVINAKMGNVVMAAGEKVTLDLYGDGLVEVAVDGKLGDALLENKGTINAQGGTVQITAKAAKQAVDNIINVSGVVDVSSVTQKGGKIILAGGDAGVVNVSGKLEASGQNGGGKVTVTGQNVAVENTTKINTNAGENGDGGDVFIYGNNFAIFSGEISARGGRYTGDGGDAEISAGQTVGYYGYTNLGAPNGETGTLLIDPTHLTISDSPFSADLAAIFTGTLFGNININDQALANTLASANVNLWASETLSTGSDIDLSTGKEQVGTVYGGILSGCFFGCPVYADTITDHNLTVAAPQVNLVHDIILGTGQLNVNDLPAGASVLGWGIINVPPGGIQVDELNLDGKIYKRTTVGGLANTLADDTQVNTTSNTINVLSDDALIQQAVQFADASDAEKETVNVAAGTYGESVKIDRSLALKGAKSGTPGVGRAGTDDSIETIVTGGSPGIIVSADDVTVDGFVLSGPTLTDGIVVDGWDRANIINNVVLNPRGHGILINNSENSQASFNKVDHTGPSGRKNGITVIGGVDTTVSDNEILNSSWDGIHVEGSSGTDILRNNISKSYQVGVVVMDGSSDTLIQDNTIYDSMRGILIRNSSDATIIGSVIYNQSLDGVHIENNSDLIAVDNNEVYDSGAGIVVRSSDNIFILNNDLHDNKAYGLFAQGNSNDAIEVTGNTFTNNRVGARFESGIIDLTKISTDPGFGPYGNKFIAGANGQTGIEFDVGRGINEQLSLVRAGGGSTYDGNDFDTLAETDTPVTFGGTIGNQYFEGYNDPLVQQFVTLGDNAFVETGTDAAIWLDASNSTFNTAGFGAFTPAIDGIGGSQEAFLQSMFYHQPDADGRGIFWFGTVDGPDLIILDARKFFEEFAPYTGGVSGLNVTITGLPRLSGGTPAGSPGISGLNQIAPAAGDEETPPQQATVTDIEPSAGGNEQPVSQNASCWGDAVTAVGAGESVTYSYGGTFEESVAAAANCNTASLF